MSRMKPPTQERLLRHRAKMQRKFEARVNQPFWFNPYCLRKTGPLFGEPRYVDPLYLWFQNCYVQRDLRKLTAEPRYDRMNSPSLY